MPSEERAVMTPSPSPAGFAMRVGTAVVIGIVTIGVVVWGGILGLAIAVAVVAMLAASEFYSVARREHRSPNEVIGIAAVAAMPIAAARWGVAGLTSSVAALLAVALCWHVAFRRVRASDTAATVFGAVYVGFALSHLVLLRALDAGTVLVLATVVSVWANDVFAYAIGSTVGRHKLAPRISPAKSWEGLAAGTAFTVAVWVGVHLVADTGITLVWHAAIGMAISVAAILGDLAESRFKREAGVKDSGRLLPGHGGFLDRFDSLVLVSIVAYYTLLLAGAR